MAKELKIIPEGWPCTLEECNPGAFLFEGQLCFKSEYANSDGKIEAYNSAGEFFCRPKECIVQAVTYEWDEE